MLIWGSKGEVADLGAQEQKHCATCEKDRTFKLMLQYKVSHIWYLFKWVSAKQYALACDVCQRGDKLDSKAVEAKHGQPPIPFMSRWSWSFLVALIAGFALLGGVNDNRRNRAVDAYTAAPQQGDVYVADMASLLKAPEAKQMYGLMRVRSVQGKQIEFDVPEVMYSKASGATKDLDRGKTAEAGYFAASSVVLGQDDIKKLRDQGAIHAVERK